MGNWEIGTGAKILIFVVILALIVAVLALAFPEIGAALGGGLNAATAGISGMIVGAMSSLYIWGAQNGLTIIVVTLGVFVASVILWELAVKRGVNKLKEKAGVTQAPATPAQPVMTQPVPVVIQEKPVATTTEETSK